MPYPLGVTWVRLRRAGSALELLHLNTHFEDGPGGAESRREGSRLMVARLAAAGWRDLPAVLTGDFNANPWSPPYEAFLAAGFLDAHRAAGHGNSAASSTYHGFRGASYFALDYGGEVFWRVDWVLARGGALPLRTTSCTTVREPGSVQGSATTTPSSRSSVWATPERRREPVMETGAGSLDDDPWRTGSR